MALLQFEDGGLTNTRHHGADYILSYHQPADITSVT
jgi:hypothetical protein